MDILKKERKHMLIELKLLKLHFSIIDVLLT